MWRGFEKFVLMGAVWPALPRPHGPTLPAALDEPFLEVVLAALETGSTAQSHVDAIQKTTNTASTESALQIDREHVQHNSTALSLARQDFGLAIDIEHSIIA
ncbi:hypothetical protein E8E14_003008 [Neopestalotiopsis sp. 37M]|nr:hypothetical protein E8E14_003008 [Neopestalotiopsis sp. 37M]